MKPKTLILMVVAIVCGLAASYMTSRVIADRSNQETEEKVTVLVAKQNLPMATHITEPEKLFEEKSFTKGEEPKKAIRELAQLKDKFLNKPLSAEQFVTPDDIDDKAGMGLSALMTQGMRAVGIKVSAEDVAGGFVQPRCRVDIMSVIQRNENETYAKVILQDILVLAVDQMASRPEDKMATLPSTVTVEVTPEQAEKLGLAMQLGRIKLTLRATGDDKRVTTRGVTPKGILQTGNDTNTSLVDPISDTPWEHKAAGSKSLTLPKVPNPPAVDDKAVAAREPPPPPPPPPPKIHVMTIINGDQVTRTPFQIGDNGETVIPITKSQPDATPKSAPASKENKPDAGASGLKPATPSSR
jgi:pilus assembly protein CpaB